MFKKWTVRPSLLLRGRSPRGCLEAGAICGGIVLLGLALGSSTLTAGERPAAVRPVLVDRLPDTGGLMVRSGGRFAFPTPRGDGQGFVRAAPAADLAPALRSNSTSGFSDLLMERMHREIDRIDKRHRDDLTRVTPAWAGHEDSGMEQLRAMYAERIITKAFDKAVDLRLEQFARTTLGLGEAWTWAENLGRRTRAATAFGRTNRQESPVDHAPPPRFTAGFGFKVAAHPRMILHTELFKIRGRIDIPLRNEPVMISIERELGAHANVMLSSSLSRRDSDERWVNLSVRLGF